MALERDFELLDDYLSNRLSGEERTAFERQMESDPELQQEFRTQQQLVESIRQQRTAALKSFLNNIPVTGATGGQSVGFAKVALWIVASGLAITTGYYLYKMKGAQQQVSTTQEVPAADSASSTPEQTQAAEQPATQPASTGEAEQAVANNATPQEAQATKPAIKQKDQVQMPNVSPAPTNQPKLEVFDPTKELNQESNDGETSADVPPVAKNATVQLEIDSDNKKYNFHYRFKNEKLFLYGSFEKDLYEIMEFFSDDKRTIFLFYNANYYLLDESQTKVTPLKAITDPALIKKLKEYRGINTKHLCKTTKPGINGAGLLLF
ncbi:MAG: hypothetical protein HC859_05395 [Bacteroidia bacterium]|nr:hypothetical protein [Bacteroidia bacterium]